MDSKASDPSVSPLLRRRTLSVLSSPFPPLIRRRRAFLVRRRRPVLPLSRLFTLSSVASFILSYPLLLSIFVNLHLLIL